MASSTLNVSRSWALALLALFACARRVEPAEPMRAPAVLGAAPTGAAAGLYAADEALRDALSGPLQYIGTGSWPGIRRMSACAFRNQRVIVVNVYCSPSEKQAFRVDVYSPTRGRVRIYAETRGTVSTRRREDYFTFTAESERPLAPSQPSLAIQFSELQGYEQRRYDAFLPACFGGQELGKAREGCLGELAPRSREWSDRNRSFLARANDDWYRAVSELRALAARYGRDPD